MLRDFGSRDFDFIETVKLIREKLLALGGVSREKGYEAIIMQGSGTFGIESVISSAIAKNGYLLTIINGAYGERVNKMAQIHGIKRTVLKVAEDEIPQLADIEKKLENEPTITHVCVVHCETTTGIINPISQIGKLSKHFNKVFIVDAMSSFGAVPVDVEACGIDFLISSSNKCIEGVPGFSFVIAKRDTLLNFEGLARTMSLDLFQQWKGLEHNGQFRFTPPTHSLLAFYKALEELEREGGVKGRAARYKENHRILVDGMRRLGFKEYLDPSLQGYIITSFHYPENPGFNFETFYLKLNDRGFVIYPGKVSRAACFRIGNIGQIFNTDIRKLLNAISHVKKEMGF